MKVLRDKIKSTFKLSSPQTNLLLLSTATSLFQGFVYYMIDGDRFAIKYFIMTFMMSFIYYIFYYKTYLNTKKK